MIATSAEKILLLTYIDAVNKYANLCKLVEDLPTKHLEVLMKAESLPMMGSRMIKALELDK